MAPHSSSDTSPSGPQKLPARVGGKTGTSGKENVPITSPTPPSSELVSGLLCAIAHCSVATTCSSGAGAMTHDIDVNNVANGPEQRTTSSAANNAANEDVAGVEEGVSTKRARLKPVEEVQPEHRQSGPTVELVLDSRQVQPRRELTISVSDAQHVFVVVDTNIFHLWYEFLKELFWQTIDTQGLQPADAERYVSPSDL